MKLKSVKIFNYKSFGNSSNNLFVSDLNVVVGKNESGKSNLIDALGNIEAIGYTKSGYFKKKNRRTNEDIKLELDFHPSENDIKKYGYSKNVSVKILGYDICQYDTDYGNYVIKNKKVIDAIDKINKFKEDNNIPISKPENRKILEEIYNRIDNIKSNMLIIPDGYSDFIDRLRNTNNEIINTLCDLFDNIFDIVDEIYECFPNFLMLKNVNINSMYPIEEFEKEIQLKEKSILYQMLDVCKINHKNMQDTINSNDPVLIKNNLDKFNQLVLDNFTTKFNEFYRQEVVDICLSINNNSLNILIKTKGDYLNYEERSNGLKWYVNIFIQLLFREKNESHVSTNNILLLDEPGVFLHSIAQQELVLLFQKLVGNENQIIYTTHSPSMIDFDNIQSIRSVEKDNEGYSHIYNKLTEFPSYSKSKLETITPIIKAMGYKLSLNIGANYKKRNIIVEGITDYFYLESYMEIKNIKKYNIIASTGADNIPAISSILYGWGCPFIVILDHDKKGKSVYDSINDSHMPFIKNVLFIDRKKYDEEDKFEIEDMFSQNDKIKLNITSDDYKEKKYFYAYGCIEGVRANNYKFDEETTSNFDDLFEYINKL